MVGSKYPTFLLSLPKTIDKKVGWSPSHLFLIKKLSIFFPFFRAATNHFGLASSGPSLA